MKDKLFPRTPNLLELTIQKLGEQGLPDFGRLPKLRKLTFEIGKATGALLAPPSLHELNITFARPIISGSGFEHDFLRACPHLLDLSVTFWNYGYGIMRADLIKSTRDSLQSLRLCNTIPELVVDMTESWTSLKALSFVNCFELADEHLEIIAAKCPNLVGLDIIFSQRYSQKFTGVGLKAVIAKGNKTGKGLLSLMLTGCEAIGSDAVDWARSQGVHVAFSRDGTDRTDNSAKPWRRIR